MGILQTSPIFARGYWALPLIVALLVAGPISAQRTRFPTSPAALQSGSDTRSVLPPVGSGSLAPVTPPTASAPPATLGTPTFDPFSTAPGAASSPPTLLGPSSASPYGAAPPGVGPTTSTPLTTAPAANAFPQQPGQQFPNGVPWSNSGTGYPQIGPYLRLFQDLRFRYTWVEGESGSDLEMHDVEVASTLNLPNFLYSGQPIGISPIFIFHFWDGPGPSLADLPAQAYSTLLDLTWNPKLTPQVSGELSGSIGVYTDFQSFTSDTIRFQGTALLVLTMTPTLTIKAGVTYLDRVDIKLLPAGGVVWQPNPQTYFDIYFPKPKLARYLTTLGNTDLWWYVGGEYGGGSWTIERIARPALGLPAAYSDRIDINDLRLLAGLEWFSKATSVKGFAEVGYIFDREIIYVSGIGTSLKPKDTVMLRGGLSY